MAEPAFAVTDRVYGRHRFTHPLLIELVSSRFLQRLKGISQYGVPDRYYHYKGFSRFEHSVGVAVLLAQSGASVREQAAGLLHDVSHTAFSHVVDVAFDSSDRDDFQDNAMPEFLDSREMMRLLAKYGLDPAEFGDLKGFTLLEQPIPKLCADRIDYCLRELAVSGKEADSHRIAGKLAVLDGEYCFATLESGREFALAYAKLQREHWSGNEARARYLLLGTSLKAAMANGEVTREQLFTDDEEVLRILEGSKDPKVTGPLGELKAGKLPAGKDLKAKVRYVDPNILVSKAKVKKLSEIDPVYAALVKVYEKKVPRSD